MNEEKLHLDQWFVDSLRLHRLAMYRLAYSQLGRAAEAEDAVSGATIKTYARLHLIRKREAIRAYLLKATINAARSQLRRRQREDVARDPEALPEASSQGETPLSFYLQSLSPKLRLALLLRYRENLPLLEICRVLNLPKGTVSARISRGLAILRQQMEQERENQNEA